MFCVTKIPNYYYYFISMELNNLHSIVPQSLKRHLQRAIYFCCILLAMAPLAAQAQTTVTVGTATASSTYFPNYYFYNYSYTQTIYTAAEITGGGAAPGANIITKIRYKPNASVSTSNWKDWVVYLGNTSKVGFASTTDWVALSDLSVVFDGTIPATVTSGTWMEITLATPFVWDGTSNLVVGIDENTPTWGSSPSWRGYTLAPSTGQKGIYYYSDGTNPNPSAPPTANSRSNNVATIQFDMTPALPCSGTPAAAIASSATDICAGVPFTLTATPSGMTGYTYQFQVSTDAGVSWSNLGTASGGSSYTVPSQTVASQYRVIVTCSGGGSSTSTAVAVAQNAPSTCYCTPATTGGTTYYITNFTTTGGTININKTSGSSATGYQDFHTTDSAKALPGTTLNYNMTVAGGSTYGRAIWIDFNENGTFETSEQIVSSTSYVSSPLSGSFTIPLATAPGRKRMRIIASFTPSNPNDPCTNSGAGEYEDYSFVVTALASCSGTPAAAITSTITTACAGVPFTLTASPTGLSGLTYQFQVSTDGGTSWSNLGTASTTPTYAIASQTVASQYRVIVSCAGGGSNTSAAVAVAQNLPSDCFCTPTTTGGTTYYISNFSTTGGTTNINKSSGGTATGYQDFHTTDSAIVNVGSTLNYTFTVAGGSTYGRAIWVDLNEDGFFQPTEQLASSTSYLSSPLTGSFTIPAGTTAGSKRMRVLASFTPSSPSNPCTNSGSGEYEDYTLNVVVPMPPVLTSLGSLSGCSGSSLVITGTALNGATSVTIGGTPATITANTPTSITVTIPTSATSGNVLVTTPIGTSNALPFTVNPTPSVTATPAAANLCDGATTAISLSSSTPATSYTWTAALLSGGPVSGFAPCTSGCGTTIAQTLSATATTPGTVRYTITPATATCTGTPVTADVTLYPNPAPTVTPASSSQCSGLATDLALSNGVTGATFSWTMPTITGGTVSGAAPGTSATAIAQTLVNTGTTAATLTYTITATNPGGGSASCTSAPVTATVIVTPGVQITTQPTAQTVCSGSAATFSVVAANATAYQWYGPSGLIPGATTPTYTITGATPALSGNYYVAVSGPAGCPVLNSDMATLTVHPPVVITTQPLSQNVCQGTPLVLSVVASGALSYQWYKDGSPIAGATTPTYTTTAAPADAGAYYVRLTPGSPCTPLNSATATITITAAGTWKGITGDWNNAANWCGGVPTATTDVILPASGSVPFDAHILNGKLGEARTVTLQNSSLTVDNGGTLHLYGDLLQSPGGSFNAAGGTVRLAGTTAQHIKPSFSAATLMTAGGGSKELGGDVTVNNYLTLGSGNLLLNGHVLRLKPGASIYGISAASYVVTNGAGAAMVQTVSGADFIFPVGMSAFNPLYLSNGGVPDSFRVTLREEVLQGGTSGAPVNPSVSTVVKRTWDVSEGTPGGSIATLTLQWNGGEENSPAFNYEHAYVAQYVGGSGWLNTCCSVADSAGTAIGSGPYTRTKTGLSTFGSFTVASSAGDAPLVVGAGAGGQEGFGVRAWPNPVGEELRVEVRGGVAGGRVSLLDVTGRELQGQSTGASQQTIRFEMKGLPQGIYLLKYTDIYHNKTIKINKE